MTEIAEPATGIDMTTATGIDMTTAETIKIIVKAMTDRDPMSDVREADVHEGTCNIKNDCPA